MQIGQLNNLIYPDYGNQPAAANPARDSSVRQAASAKDAPEGSPSAPSASATWAKEPLPADLVYSHTRKSTAAADTDADAALALEQHRQATARSADSPSSLSLDKDGVLVSKPASPDRSSQAFMTFAVNTMRQYADEQDRLKTLAKDTAGAGPASLIPRSLGDVQKLASRFKPFA